MTTRRYLLQGLLGGATVCMSWPLFLKAEEDQPLGFQMEVPVAHIAAVKSELSFQGTVTVNEDEKGAPLVFIYAGLVLLPYLAKAILALRRDMVYGGVIIDLRGDKIVIQADKSLPSGIVVVIDTNGEHHLYERDEIENQAELIKVLLSAK